MSWPTAEQVLKNKVCCSEKERKVQWKFETLEKQRKLQYAGLHVAAGKWCPRDIFIPVSNTYQWKTLRIVQRFSTKGIVYN